MKNVKYQIFIIFLVLFLPYAINAQYVIIVSGESPADSLSLEEIKQVFHGQTPLRFEGVIFQVVEYKRHCNRFYKKLLNKSAYSVTKNWIKLIFSGEKVKPPRSFSDVKKLCKYVEKNKEAIGFIPISEFKRVKELKIKVVVIHKKNFNYYYVLK